MLRKGRGRVAGERGFALVELLVVILIIGILAAIAVPAFLSNRQKAQDVEAKTAARTAATAMKTWYTDHDTYAGATTAELKKIESSLGQGQGATLSLGNLGASTFTVTVDSKTGNKFSLSENGGVITRTCSTPGTAACPSSGGW